MKSGGRGGGVKPLPSCKVIKGGEIKYKAIYRTTFFMVIYFTVQTGSKVGDL